MADFDYPDWVAGLVSDSRAQSATLMSQGRSRGVTVDFVDG